MHDVVQVFPQNDFSVFVYFANGVIKHYDMTPLLNKGVFQKISKIEDFKGMCTVLNNTLAWDLSGRFDPYNCIDIAPDSIYEHGKSVKDPLSAGPGGAGGWS